MRRARAPVFGRSLSRGSVYCLGFRDFHLARTVQQDPPCNSTKRIKASGLDVVWVLPHRTRATLPSRALINPTIFPHNPRICLLSESDQFPNQPTLLQRYNTNTLHRTDRHTAIASKPPCLKGSMQKRSSSKKLAALSSS